WIEIKPLPDTTVFSHLIVLRFKTKDENRVRTLTIFQDQMTTTEFRVLRLWLRWQTASPSYGEVL
ncbi:MAG: hypothetical protein J0653_01250, partial [Deltaproteobacteria bacterium]|nr:hypothetical protein [Deltaproteobacteria bacterium]